MNSDSSGGRITHLHQLQRAVGPDPWAHLSQIRQLRFDSVASALELETVFVERVGALGGKAWRVVLAFAGVRRLTLRDAGEFLQISGFVIRAAPHGVPWLEAGDYEDGRISFLADSCDVVDVTPCSNPWPR